MSHMSRMLRAPQFISLARPHPSRRRRRLAAWVIAAGLAAAAPTVHAQEKLTVAVGGRGIGESCLTEIGKNAGIFARHGLDLTLVYTDGSGETQQAVVSNSAQIGVTSGMLGAMSLYAKGAPVRVIGSSYSGGSQIYWFVPAELASRRLRAISKERPSAIRPIARRAMSACSACRSTTSSISSSRRPEAPPPPSRRR